VLVQSGCGGGVGLVGWDLFDGVGVVAWSVMTGLGGGGGRSGRNVVKFESFGSPNRSERRLCLGVRGGASGV